MPLPQCVILAGGLGTRLGDMVKDCPKPMLPVCERPFIEHLLHRAVLDGFRRFLILAGYKAEVIRFFFEEGKARLPNDVTVDVIVEPQPLGTGGALLHAWALLEPEFVLMNGDTVTSIPLGAFANEGVDENAPCRMALRRHARNDRYGEVDIDGNRVVLFQERPATPRPSLINAGLYLLRRDALKEIFATIPSPCFSLEKDVFPLLVQQKCLYASVYDARFIDIGIPEDFARAEHEFRELFRPPALFLDRDGVLNEECGYLHRIEDLTWLPGAREALCQCRSLHLPIFVVTNQAGVARGLYDEKDVRCLHNAMQNELRAMNADITAFHYCPHHPDYSGSCLCRKPNPGMIEDLAERYGIDLPRSVLIGDKQSDVQAGHAAGIGVSILVATGHGKEALARLGLALPSQNDAYTVTHGEAAGPDAVADNFPAALEYLKRIGHPLVTPTAAASE